MTVLCSGFGSCIGNKYTNDGKIREFHGNTIICQLTEEMDVYHRIERIQREIAGTRAGGCLKFLPPESFHMTAMEGVCDANRLQERWTSKLPTDCTLSEVDDLFEHEWKKIPPLEGVKMRFRMIRCNSALQIGLETETEAQERRIRTWRDEVSRAFGIRFPGHDTYRFHVSMAYGFSYPTKEEMETLRGIKSHYDASFAERPYSFILPSPRLTFFKSMHCFSPARIERP